MEAKKNSQRIMKKQNMFTSKFESMKVYDNCSYRITKLLFTIISKSFYTLCMIFLLGLLRLLKDLWRLTWIVASCVHLFESSLIPFAQDYLGRPRGIFASIFFSELSLKPQSISILGHLIRLPMTHEVLIYIGFLVRCNSPLVLLVHASFSKTDPCILLGTFLPKQTLLFSYDVFINTFV